MNQKHIHFSWNPIHPHRDWKRLMIVFTILVLAVIGVSTHLFFSLGKSGESSSVGGNASEDGESTIKRVDRISAFFENRQ